MVRKVLEESCDMVIEDRLSFACFTENKRPFHNTGNVLARKLVNGILDSNVTDIMTGYRVFSRLFVKKFPVLSKGFEIETEVTIYALDKNLVLDSIPVGCRDRPEGSVSKLNTFSDGFKVLGTIGKLFMDYKPLPFFSSVSVVLMGIAFRLLIPMLVEYYRTELVPRLPTFVTDCFMALFALQTLVRGLILDTQGKRVGRTLSYR